MRPSFTYPRLFQNKLVWYLWRKFLCKRHWHLWDEVRGTDHYLYCDACEIDLPIAVRRKHIAVRRTTT